MARARRDAAGGITRLVELLGEHGEAINYDLRAELGLSLADVVTGRVSLRELGSLLRLMPVDGTAQWRHARRNPAPDREAVEPPDEWWTAERDLLAGIRDDLAALFWTKTKDAQDGRGFPTPIPRPGTRPKDAPEPPARLPQAQAISLLDRIGPSGRPSLDTGDDEHGEPEHTEGAEDRAGDGEVEPSLASAGRVAQAGDGEAEADHG